MGQGNEIAQETWTQIPLRTKIAVGALAREAVANGRTLWIRVRIRRGATHKIKITLAGNDTYCLELHRILALHEWTPDGPLSEVITTVDDIYFDMLGPMIEQLCFPRQETIYADR